MISLGNQRQVDATPAVYTGLNAWGMELHVLVCCVSTGKLIGTPVMKIMESQEEVCIPSAPPHLRQDTSITNL